MCSCLGGGGGNVGIRAASCSSYCSRVFCCCPSYVARNRFGGKHGWPAARDLVQDGHKEEQDHKVARGTTYLRQSEDHGALVVLGGLALTTFSGRRGGAAIKNRGSIKENSTDKILSGLVACWQ